MKEFERLRNQVPKRLKVESSQAGFFVYLFDSCLIGLARPEGP